MLEKKQRAIFDACWIYVGHASALARPGDFRTRHVAERRAILDRKELGAIGFVL